MNTLTRLGVFVVGLAVVFAAAVGIGNAVGPIGTAGVPTQDTDHQTDMPHVP